MGITYIILGLAAAAVPGFEVFPFFCWFLFPVVPGNEYRYELMIEKHPLVNVEQRINYQELGWVKDPMAMDLWLATRRLGYALNSGDDRLATKTRSLIEGNFICAPTQYAIDRVQFDPLDRWHTHTVQERKTLATFTAEAPCKTPLWEMR